MSFVVDDIKSQIYYLYVDINNTYKKISNINHQFIEYNHIFNYTQQMYNQKEYKNKIDIINELYSSINNTYKELNIKLLAAKRIAVELDYLDKHAVKFNNNILNLNKIELEVQNTLKLFLDQRNNLNNLIYELENSYKSKDFELYC